MALKLQEPHFRPAALHLNSYQRGYFTYLTPRGSPLGQVKVVTIDGFHIHIGEVMGLQSFFVFYGPSGIVCAVCRTGITIQREVRESSNRPHYSKSNTSHIRMPSLTHYWQRKWFMLPAICLLYFPIRYMTSSAGSAFHWLQKTNTDWQNALSNWYSFFFCICLAEISISFRKCDNCCHLCLYSIYYSVSNISLTNHQHNVSKIILLL